MVRETVVAIDMAGTHLTPEKITSPIQLMAAWFSMLVLLVTVLLTAAAKIEKPAWASGFLVVFASVVSISVIACVFLMLTKFRPHLQAGKEYAQWLKDQNRYSPGLPVVRTESLSDRPPKPLLPAGAGLYTTPAKSFLCSVQNAAGSVNLVEALKNLGFNAEVYEPPISRAKESSTGGPAEHQAIWLGSRVDPRAAVMAIATAIHEWPHLQYVHLSGDNEDAPDYIHDQIFFGGATSSAIRDGLRAWSAADFQELKKILTFDELHLAIRKRYG